jgi:hypothetical protein
MRPSTRDREKRDKPARPSLVALIMIVGVALGLALAIRGLPVKP